MLKTHEKIVTSLIAISVLVYLIGILAGNDFLIDLMSPITVGLVIVILTSELPRLGAFKWSSVAMDIGLTIWFVADVLFFCNDYIIPDRGTLTQITDDIYLFPNAFYVLCISIFMTLTLRKRKIEYAFLMSNTLCFSIIGFVLIYRFYVFASGENYGTTHYKELIFFFLSFYTIMMCIQLFTFIGTKNLFKGTNWTAIGILGYSILDLYYDYMLALGKNPENDFVNFFYVVFMVLMGIGTTVQLKKNYIFNFIPRDFSKKATQKRILICAILMVFDLSLIITDFLTDYLGFYILITLLSYLITNYVFYSDNLDKKMLKYQKEQNAILEEKILEKTKDLEEANKNLHIMSTTDVLTGLQNRRSSVEFIKNLMKEYAQTGQRFAVICVDLNNFKPVNDTYGHEVGDKVLAEFGKRMVGLPQQFKSYRVGGDEFLICMTDITDRAEVEKAAADLQELFHTPIIYDNSILNLSASMGIAIFPQDCEQYELLLSYADAAMYDIKKGLDKDGYKFYDSSMSHLVDRRASIKSALQKADPNSDFVLHYQPQVDPATRKILGVEVYPHMKGDMEKISPAELIPIAEETGLMSALGIWIAKEAFATISKWNKKFNLDIGFTINLSPLQLSEANLIDQLQRLGKEYGIESGKVFLDISNQVIIGASHSARDVMKSLSEFGYKLSLNDFGGDNINLSYLMDCGISRIELSRKLVASLENDESTRTLIKSIIKFASTMDIAVAAVGIENEKQCDMLREMGITLMQGYLISMPVDNATFELFLSQS